MPVVLKNWLKCTLDYVLNVKKYRFGGIEFARKYYLHKNMQSCVTIETDHNSSVVIGHIPNNIMGG